MDGGGSDISTIYCSKCEKDGGCPCENTDNDELSVDDEYINENSKYCENCKDEIKSSKFFKSKNFNET